MILWPVIAPLVVVGWAALWVAYAIHRVLTPRRHVAPPRALPCAHVPGGPYR